MYKIISYLLYTLFFILIYYVRIEYDWYTTFHPYFRFAEELNYFGDYFFHSGEFEPLLYSALAISFIKELLESFWLFIFISFVIGDNLLLNKCFFLKLIFLVVLITSLILSSYSWEFIKTVFIITLIIHHIKYFLYYSTKTQKFLYYISIFLVFILSIGILYFLYNFLFLKMTLYFLFLLLPIYIGFYFGKELGLKIYNLILKPKRI